MSDKLGYDYQAALIVVTDVEEQAVLHAYPDWERFHLDGDSQEYYRATFQRDGRTHRIVAARQDEMGMTACAVLSMKLIGHFRPRYLIMTGIAAGVALKHIEEQEYGDVVVADLLWNYSAGKFVSPDRADVRFGEVGFIPRPTVVSSLDGIREYIEAAARSEKNQCHVHIGPMASGSAVVANSAVLDKQIHSQVRQTAGLDMESYAVAYTAAHAPEPRPRAIVIKSVCDFADSRKDDRFQKFAAYTSMEFAKLLYEEFLPLEGD